MNYSIFFAILLKKKNCNHCNPNCMSSRALMGVTLMCCLLVINKTNRHSASVNQVNPKWPLCNQNILEGPFDFLSLRNHIDCYNAGFSIGQRWFEELLTWHNLKKVPAGFFRVGCQLIHLAALQWDAALHRYIVTNASLKLCWLKNQSNVITMRSWM